MFEQTKLFSEWAGSRPVLARKLLTHQDDWRRRRPIEIVEIAS